MSQISYRPRGGQEGIDFTMEEQNKLANSLKSEYRDLYVPLPEKTIQEQTILIKKCKEHSNETYFENENGSHGWCCGKCGTVLQWG